MKPWSARHSLQPRPSRSIDGIAFNEYRGGGSRAAVPRLHIHQRQLVDQIGLPHANRMRLMVFEEDVLIGEAAVLALDPPMGVVMAKFHRPTPTI